MGFLDDRVLRYSGTARTRVVLGTVLCLFACSDAPRETTRPVSSIHRGGVLRTVQEAPRSLDPEAKAELERVWLADGKGGATSTASVE